MTHAHTVFHDNTVPTIDLSSTAISSLLSSLPREALDNASPTHLPTQLPLTLPTPLHTVNLLSILHMVYSTLSHPHRAAYFADAAGSDAKDMAIRGVMGIFLASDSSWGAQNLLSAASWRANALDEGRVADFFRIETMREKEHESMPGVKVGERYPPGVRCCEALVKLFHTLGGKVPGQCVGEVVGDAIKRAREGTAEGPQGGAEFAKAFCTDAIHFDPSMTDPYTPPSGTVLPAAPLRLLQDLSYRQHQSSDLDLPLPHPSDLANISPLPLPLPFLLYLGIFDLDDTRLPLDDLKQSVGKWWKHEADIFASCKATSSASGAAVRPPKVLEVPKDVYTAMQTASVDACREIWAHAKFGKGESWQTEMTMKDVAKVVEHMEGIMDKEGLGVRLTPK